jgi:hypothetical protein
LMASIALAVFGRSNGSRWRCPRSPRSIGRDLDLGLDSEGRLRTSASKVRLAIRTSRPYLSATNVRLEHIRILDHACEQHQADRCPCAGHSPWAPLRPAYRYPQLSMGDARPGRPVDDLGVTPRHAPQSPSTIGGAPGIQSPFAGLIPLASGERTFPFAPDPACALATAIHFPTVFVGRPPVPVTCWTRRSRDGVVALPGSGVCS